MSLSLSRIASVAILAALIGFSVLFFVWEEPFAYMISLMGENIVISAILFVTILFCATVFAPLSAMPLIPVAATIFGPFLTGVLSTIGWTLGSVVAFLIARYAGRVWFLRLVSQKELKKWEAWIPPKLHFLAIVCLRMAIPADILSYALGLISSVSLRTYTYATFVGVMWFSFAFAYMGEALYTDDTKMLLMFGLPSIVMLIMCWVIIFRIRK